jgi:hypothetical protein
VGLGGEAGAALLAQMVQMSELLEGGQEFGGGEAIAEGGVADLVIGNGETDILAEAAEFNDEGETLVSGVMGDGHAVNSTRGAGEGLAGFTELAAGEPSARHEAGNPRPTFAGHEEIAALETPDVEVVHTRDPSSKAIGRFVERRLEAASQVDVETLHTSVVRQADE